MNEKENQQETSSDNESIYSQNSFNPFSPLEEEPKKRQSRLGITSFIIGLISIVIFVIGIIVMTTFIMNQNFADGNSLQLEIENSIKNNDYTAYAPILIGIILLFTSAGLGLIGLIFGIVGACIKNTRKAFSVIGIILNALLPVGLAVLFLVGILLGSTS
ncbi:hypothetical protein Back11_28780 [Paenibacillus baekrokdamisoli]|uniref:Uncharacterized protein n=1 Tax=Paenibacillus baekrokdamisoli TaxID=1712516 RepID=A0A3G9J9H5_9BACL|nr:hypothetical protein [Paenibacillus baekrokdamisoli]MBB3071115.1 magnesium-transporting ATPase (P-type) [Paenibacillus baekrokdamisoli]BBH21533.1 hypothetical protein Back11_28780 [Paenibacillus baekrokdamisoli]